MIRCGVKQQVSEISHGNFSQRFFSKTMGGKIWVGKSAKMSDQNPGYLLYNIGYSTTQLYIDCNKHQ